VKFLAKQVKVRAEIRVNEGRAKPLDYIIHNMYTNDPKSVALVAPYAYLKVLLKWI